LELGITDLSQGASALRNKTTKPLDLQSAGVEAISQLGELLVGLQSALGKADPNADIEHELEEFHKQFEELLGGEWSENTFALATLDQEVHTYMQEWRGGKLVKCQDKKQSHVNEGKVAPTATTGGSLARATYAERSRRCLNAFRAQAQ
jgi:hypothetical protein